MTMINPRVCTLALIGLTLTLVSPAFAKGNNAQSDGGANPPWSQANQYYDPGDMAAARKAVQKESGGQTAWFVMADRLETSFANGEDALVWDAQGWVGGDIDKLWVKTEGDYSFDNNKVEEAEVQALWSRAIAPYFDLQAGVRYDPEPRGRTHAVISIQGLAPYWFDIDAAAFVSNKGDITTRIETEYELLLTQRLILQPRLEVELSAQKIPELEVGSGITHLDAGLRLRYEIRRELAPYIGVEWQKAFGGTADYIKAGGGKSDRAVLVLGIRLWY